MLVRIYGKDTETIIDRDLEVEVRRCMFTSQVILSFLRCLKNSQSLALSRECMLASKTGVCTASVKAGRSVLTVWRRFATSAVSTHTPALDIRTPHLQKLIAEELARWHTTHVPELPHEPSLFPRMKHWAKAAKEITASFSFTIGDRKYDWKDLDEEVGAFLLRFVADMDAASKAGSRHRGNALSCCALPQ